MGNKLKRLKRDKLKRKETRARKNSPVLIHGSAYDNCPKDELTQSILDYVRRGNI